MPLALFIDRQRFAFKRLNLHIAILADGFFDIRLNFVVPLLRVFAEHKFAIRLDHRPVALVQRDGVLRPAVRLCLIRPLKRLFERVPRPDQLVIRLQRAVFLRLPLGDKLRQLVVEPHAETLLFAQQVVDLRLAARLRPACKLFDHLLRRAGDKLLLHVRFRQRAPLALVNRAVDFLNPLDVVLHIGPVAVVGRLHRRLLVGFIAAASFHAVHQLVYQRLAHRRARAQLAGNVQPVRSRVVGALRAVHQVGDDDFRAVVFVNHAREFLEYRVFQSARVHAALSRFPSDRAHAVLAACRLRGFLGLRVLWCALHNLFGLRGLHGLRILCVRCNLYVRLCLCALRGLPVLCSLFGLRVLFGRLCLCGLFLGGIGFRVAQPLPRFLQRRHPFGNFVCARHQLGDGVLVHLHFLRVA